MTRAYYIVYDPDGRIVRGGDCRAARVAAQAIEASELSLSTPTRESGRARCVDVTDPAKPVVIDRPPNPATPTTGTITADGVDLLVITGIPFGSSYIIHGEDYMVGTIDDGFLNVTSDTPGDIVIDLESFPPLNVTLRITAL